MFMPYRFCPIEGGENHREFFRRIRIGDRTSVFKLECQSLYRDATEA